MSPLLEDIEHGLAVLLQTLVGLFFMFGGAAWFAYQVLNPPLVASHLIGAGSVSVFGAAVLPSVGPLVMKALKAVAGVVQSFLPARKDPPTP